MEDSYRILIVGLTRDSENYLKNEINHFYDIFSSFGEVSFHFVESDSRDQTVSLLNSLTTGSISLTFQSLGSLETRIKIRTERLRFCRNAYVKWIRESNLNFDFIVVADFDGMNRRLSKSAVESSLVKQSLWTACFANQLFGYFDLYALRCQGWIEHDFFPELRSEISKLEPTGGTTFLNGIKRYFQEDSIRWRMLYRNMKVLLPWAPLIPVESAFGALGIYKQSCFEISDYGSIAEEYSECEHVFFHRKILETGASLVINPRMINSWVNPYNLNKFFLTRLSRRLSKR
jgi:hypothetical protein